jgi:hypothetical protein
VSDLGLWLLLTLFAAGIGQGVVMLIHGEWAGALLVVTLGVAGVGVISQVRHQ